MPERTNNTLLEALGRIEERLGGVAERQDEIRERLAEETGRLGSRVAILESRNGHAVDDLRDDLHHVETRLALLEVAGAGHKARWEKISDYVMKIVFAVLSAWALVKLGLKP